MTPGQSASFTATLRVGHAEREPVVDQLQRAYAEGRLDKAELDQRLDRAMTAKTHGDLDALLVDLTPQTPALYPPGPAGAPPGDDRLLAALAHASGVFSLFVGPLIMYCVAGRRSPFLRGHIAAALNFQLTLLLVTIVTFGIGGIAYAVAWIVASAAALFALAGSPFQYPLTLQIVR